MSNREKNTHIQAHVLINRDRLNEGTQGKGGLAYCETVLRICTARTVIEINEFICYTNTTVFT